MPPMRRHSRSARAVWLACALMQLTLPGAAAWADALLDATPVGPATTHFESQTTGSCPRLHPPDCVLCQFLTAPRSTAQRISFAFDLAAIRIRPLAAPVLAFRAGRLSHPESRAPPALS
jgi:hypothetical protein